LLKVDRQGSTAGPAPTGAAALPGRRVGGWLLGLVGLGLLLLALTGGLAWSYRSAPPFALDLGTGDDAEPFIDGFHQPEETPGGELTFRWSRASATVLVPAFGRRDAVLTLRLAGAGRDDAPFPAVAVLAGGQEIAQLATTTAVQTYTAAVPASLMHGGDALIELRTTTFRPPNDNRALGVLVDAVQLEAVGGAPALPPWRLLLAAGVAVIATAVVGAATTARPALALLLAAPIALAILAGSFLDRYTQALWLRDGAPLVAISALLALAGLAVTRVVSRQSSVVSSGSPVGHDPAAATQHSALSTQHSSLTTGLLWLILWAVALANLLGVAHPQFESSDLTMNVHKLEEVSQGRWLQTMALPGRSALPAPYPPAYYALLLPFMPFLDVADRWPLVTHSSALLLTGLAAIAFVVAARAAGPAAGLWAATLHGFAPAGFLLVSQGNFANIFGQAAAGLLLLLLATLPDWRRPLAAAGIVGAMLLAFLGHFGVFLSLLLAVPAMALFVATLPPDGRRRALTLLGLFAAALVIAALVYYRHYVGLAAEVAGRIASARAAGGAEALGWHAGLGPEWRRTLESLGWLALPLAAVGVVGLWRGRSEAGRLTLGWLAASALFGLVGLALGLSVRYQFFALLGLAIAGGWALAWLGRRGRLGVILAAALAAVWVVGGLLFWYSRVLTYLH
jgi:hypothetical protein